VTTDELCKTSTDVLEVWLFVELVIGPTRNCQSICAEPTNFGRGVATETHDSVIMFDVAPNCVACPDAVKAIMISRALALETEAAPLTNILKELAAVTGCWRMTIATGLTEDISATTLKGIALMIGPKSLENSALQGVFPLAAPLEIVAAALALMKNRRTAPERKSVFVAVPCAARTVRDDRPFALIGGGTRVALPDALSAPKDIEPLDEEVYSHAPGSHPSLV